MKSQDDISLDKQYKLCGKESLIDILSIVLDKDVDQVSNLTIAQTDYYVNELKWLQNSKPESKMSSVIEIEGKKYYINDNILNDMCLGQFIDFENYLTNKDFKDYHKIISIFLKPDNIKYSEQNKNNISEKIKELPITEVMGLVDFFFLFIQNIRKNIQKYIKKNQQDQVEISL